MMDELIKRLEAATGPSRELDQEICLALGWTFQKMKGDHRPYFREPGVTEYYQRSEPPYYTSSIDAALTLVPEGMGWSVSKYAAPPPFAFVHTGPTKCIHKYGATPAIALCIAALKARL